MAKDLVSCRPILLVFFYTLFSFVMTTNGLKVQLIRRDKIDTNLFPKNISELEKHQIYADLARSRALHFAEQDTSFAVLASSSLNLSTGVRPMTDQIRPRLKQVLSSMFVVPIAIGSQRYATHLLFDSGSDFTWVQCTGCEGCFKMRDRPFNPVDSDTYHKLTPGSSLCRKNIGSENLCKFNITYLGGKAVVEGNTSTENVHFTTKTPGTYQTVPRVVLGCAQSTTKITFGRNTGAGNPIAGIIGMAKGLYTDSFMETSKAITKSKFSYCLPPWKDAGEVETNVFFGDDVKRRPLYPPSARTTPLLKAGYYKVGCQGISVAGKRLDLSPELFNSGGFALDTGSASTSLVDDAYQKVKTAFTEILRRYISSEPRPVDPYELCYPGPLPRIPEPSSLTFHFDNKANLNIDFGNVFKDFPQPDGSILVCMVMRSSGGRTSKSILGAVNMADYRFVHDLERMTLTFYRETCGGN